MEESIDPSEVSKKLHSRYFGRLGKCRRHGVIGGATAPVSEKGQGREFRTVRLLNCKNNSSRRLRNARRENGKEICEHKVWIATFIHRFALDLSFTRLSFATLLYEAVQLYCTIPERQATSDLLGTLSRSSRDIVTDSVLGAGSVRLKEECRRDSL